jgi:hypothetical protein
MRELHYVRPDYVTRGDGKPTTFPEAHRVARMAIAVGEVLGVTYNVMLAATDALERAANDTDAEERRYTSDEVALMAEALEEIQRQLAAAIDPDQFPRGSGGERIKREAAEPKEFDSGAIDADRVFELDDDGRISTIYPRMSLNDFIDTLPKLVEFFRDATSRNLEVALIEQ